MHAGSGTGLRNCDDGGRVGSASCAHEISRIVLGCVHRMEADPSHKFLLPLHRAILRPACVWRFSFRSAIVRNGSARSMRTGRQSTGPYHVHSGHTGTGCCAVLTTLLGCAHNESAQPDAAPGLPTPVHPKASITLPLPAQDRGSGPRLRNEREGTPGCFAFAIHDGDAAPFQTRSHGVCRRIVSGAPRGIALRNRRGDIALGQSGTARTEARQRSAWMNALAGCGSSTGGQECKGGTLVRVSRASHT